jgi:hypothetical protein
MWGQPPLRLRSGHGSRLSSRAKLDCFSWPRPGCRRPRRLRFGFRKSAVELEIQHQHVHACLAEKSKLARLRMLGYEASQFVFANAARLCHTRHLKRGRRRSNVGIKPRSGSSYQIDRNRSVRIFRLQSSRVGFHAVSQLMISGSKLRSVGIVRLISVARGGRPRMKVRRTSKGLADDLRPHHFSIGLNQLSVCFLSSYRSA